MSAEVKQVFRQKFLMNLHLIYTSNSRRHVVSREMLRENDLSQANCRCFCLQMETFLSAHLSRVFVREGRDRKLNGRSEVNCKTSKMNQIASEVKGCTEIRYREINCPRHALHRFTSLLNRKEINQEFAGAPKLRKSNFLSVNESNRRCKIIKKTWKRSP